MALIDLKCLDCGAVEEVYRAAVDWPKTPACPKCGSEATEQIHLPKRTQWSVEPVVVFKAPDGGFRFPGDANGRSAKNYEQQGFQRIEIRGAAEMRAFESRMNKAEYSKAVRQVERKHEARERRESEMRGELRQKMQSMSRFGQAVARAAMARNDARPRKRAEDPGFMSEVYSYDRSNRDESRAADGRRRRD